MFKQSLFIVLLLAACLSAAPSVGFSDYALRSMNETTPAKMMSYHSSTFTEYCRYDWGNSTPGTAGSTLYLYGGILFGNESHPVSTNNSSDGFEFSGLKPDNYLRTCWITTPDNETFTSETRQLQITSFSFTPSSSDFTALALVAMGAILLYISFGGDKIG